MVLRRFFIERLAGETVVLDAEQSAHARKTLRLGVGDEVELFDGAGTLAVGRITDAAKRLTLAIEHRWTESPPRPWLELAVPPPKGSRADTLVEGATQLGVDRLIWLSTARSVVDPSPTKQQRFERLAIEAAKQCRRAHRMRIDSAMDRDAAAVMRDSAADLRLIADPQGQTTAAMQGLQSDGKTPLEGSRILRAERVLVLVGPEGGWTDGERQHAAARGFVTWRFSPHVLRVGTAALAAAAIVRALAEP